MKLIDNALELKFVICVAAMGFLGVSGARAQSCSPAASNVVSWWPGDGNANDIIGGNNGTLVGGVTFAPGKVGQAFSFDGTSGYVNVADTGNLDIPGPLTIDVWVQLNTLQYQYIFAKEPLANSATFSNYQLLVQGQPFDSDNAVEFDIGDGTTYYRVLSQTQLTASAWYNIAAVYDGNKMIIYLNGAQDNATIIGSKTLYTNPSAPVEIGYSGYLFAGLIDEPQIYNRALSAAEIQAIYNAGAAGAGNCKGLVFSPASLSFPRQPLGTTSAPKTVTATNAFPLSVTVGSITTSGDFAQTNNCATVAPGATCNANITFNPTHPGTRHGTLTFDSNAPASPQTVGLTGAATDISLSPTRLNFGTYPVGTASAPKTVTVTNVGSTVVTFTAIGIKGTDPQDFVISNNNCPSLAPGASCPVSVEFKPTAAGTRTATLEFSDNGGASPQTVSLTGKGTNISLAPARLNFGNHPVGSTSATRTITVTNAGAVTVNFTGSPGITGTDPQDFSLSSGTCGASLAAGASCTIGVRFAPTATGARIATLSVFDDDAGSPQTAVLFGTGT